MVNGAADPQDADVGPRGPTIEPGAVMTQQQRSTNDRVRTTVSGPRTRTRRATPFIAALVVAAAFPAIAGAAVVEPLDNAEPNWSFESGVTGWGGWNSAVTQQTDTAAPDGSSVAKTVCNVSGGCAGGYTLDDDPAPFVSSQQDQTYTGVAWVKGTGSGVGQTVSLTVREDFPGDAPDNQSKQDVKLTSSWQRVTTTLTAKTTGKPVDLYLAGREGAANGEGFLTDAASLTSSVLPPGQTVQNPSFENGTTGWGGYLATLSNAAAGSEDAPHGRRAVQVSCSNSGNACSGGYSIDDSPAAVRSSIGGAKYTATAMVKAGTNSNGKTAGIVVRETNPTTGAVVGSTETPVTLSSSYQPVKATYTASSASGNEIDVYVRRTSTTSASDSFFVDAVSMTSDVAPVSSRVGNGSFERGLSGWGSWNGSLSRDLTTPAPDGVASAKVTCNSGSACADGYTIDDDPASIASTTKGFTYTATAHVRAVGAPASRQVGVVIREWNPTTNTQVGSLSEQQVTLTSTFQRVSVSRTVTTTGNQLEVYVRRPSGTAGEAFLVDAISLRPTAFPTSAGTCTNLLIDAPTPGACSRPYEPIATTSSTLAQNTSPFYQTIPSGQSAATGSTNTVDWLMSFSKAPSPLGFGDSRTDYGVPVYRAGTGSGNAQYTLQMCSGPECWDDAHLNGAKIWIPVSAEPAGGINRGDGRDAHMTVVQPVDGAGQRIVVDLWHVTQKFCTDPVNRKGCTLTFGGSGVSNAQARATPTGAPLVRGRGAVLGAPTTSNPDGTDAVSLGANVGLSTTINQEEIGTVASGWGSTLGAIRAQELDNGIIPHALDLVVPCVKGQVAPAHHKDGDCDVDFPNASPAFPSANAARMGERFQLNMTDDQILALNAPDWKLAILKALATYGAFVSDTGGGGRTWGFEIESGLSYTTQGQTDPMVTFANRNGLTGTDPDANGVLEYSIDPGTGVDWKNNLRVVNAPGS
jgi:hypothetical protein